MEYVFMDVMGNLIIVKGLGKGHVFYVSWIEQDYNFTFLGPL